MSTRTATPRPRGVRIDQVEVDDVETMVMWGETGSSLLGRAF